jgi:hypothetical protein
VGTRRLFLILAGFALLLCALPAPASAAMRKATGKTNQGLAALAWVRDDNSVALVKLKYKTRCRAPGYTAGSTIYFRDNERKPFVRDGALFSDGGKFEGPYKRGKVVFTTAMAGGPSADGGWEGTFRVQMRFYNRQGRQIDFCKTGVRRWKVGPAA